jgi:hypothetical protein
MSVITSGPKQIVSESLQALSDFNKRVERIRKFFIYRLAKRGMLRTAVQESLGEPRRSGTRRPSQEQIDALVNNLRFFIQNNEATSFENLAKTYASLPIPPTLKREFEDCRERLNRWLDGKSSLGMKGSPLIHRRILWVFVYGDVAHLSLRERKELERWRENQPFFRLLKTHFVNTLGKFTRFLDETAVINQEALSHLNG